MSEVIYGKSKTKEQIAGIVGAMLEEKEKTILITRMSRKPLIMWHSNIT